MLNSMSEISYNRIGTNNLKEKEKIGNERFRPRLHLRGPIKTGLSIPYSINFWPKYPVSRKILWFVSTDYVFIVNV